MAARCEHQSGNELTGLPHLGHNREPVFARKHHIQDHDIEPVRFRAQRIQRGFSVIDYLNLITFRLQVETQSIG
jgi:hypothetical protein